MSLPLNKTFLNEPSETMLSNSRQQHKNPKTKIANPTQDSTLSKEIQAPDIILADCLKSCGLTVADLELNNLSGIIKETLELPGCRYPSLEDFVENVESRLRFF